MNTGIALLTALVTTAPSVLVYAVGAVLAIALVRRHPLASGLAATGFTGLILAAVARTTLNTYRMALLDAGEYTQIEGLAYAQVALAALDLPALALIIAAAVAERSLIPDDEP